MPGENCQTPTGLKYIDVDADWQKKFKVKPNRHVTDKLIEETLSDMVEESGQNGEPTRSLKIVKNKVLRPKLQNRFKSLYFNSSFSIFGTLVSAFTHPYALDQFSLLAPFISTPFQAFFICLATSILHDIQPLTRIHEGLYGLYKDIIKFAGDEEILKIDDVRKLGPLKYRAYQIAMEKTDLAFKPNKLPKAYGEPTSSPTNWTKDWDTKASKVSAGYSFNNESREKVTRSIKKEANTLYQRWTSEVINGDDLRNPVCIGEFGLNENETRIKLEKKTRKREIDIYLFFNTSFIQNLDRFELFLLLQSLQIPIMFIKHVNFIETPAQETAQKQNIDKSYSQIAIFSQFHIKHQSNPTISQSVYTRIKSVNRQPS